MVSSRGLVFNSVSSWGLDMVSSLTGDRICFILGGFSKASSEICLLDNSVDGRSTIVADFLVADFLVADFLVADFLVADFLVTDFLVADFLVADFFVADFFVADFLVADFFVVDFFVFVRFFFGTPFGGFIHRFVLILHTLPFDSHIFIFSSGQLPEEDLNPYNLPH